MGTPDTTRPGRARLGAIAALLAGLALLLAACAAGGTTERNSSQISRPGGAATVPGGAAGVPVAVAAAVAPAALTGPGAGSWGGGRLDLFFRNSRDGQLAHQWYLPGPLATWTAAESLGGALTRRHRLDGRGPHRHRLHPRGADRRLVATRVASSGELDAIRWLWPADTGRRWR
jgi:hypothetical protein